MTDRPTGNSLEGSGSNFLSNEIFYRVALKRDGVRRNLASGHFHVPSIGFDPNGTGAGSQLIAGVRKALSRFFEYGFRFSGPASIAFPRTVINTTSAEQMLTVINNSTETLKIGAVDVAAPFSVTLPSPLPITVNAGASVIFPVRFTPTATGPHSGKVTLRELSGEVLFVAEVSGEGVANQPQPFISSFSPDAGPPGTFVSITGDNFVDVVDVRISGNSLGYNVNGPTDISAFVGDVPSGFIEVETLYGTASSSSVFFVDQFPPDYPPNNQV